MSDDNVTKLPINFKAPPSDDGPMLQIVDRYERDACNHSWQFTNGRQVNARYLIREGETEVECSLCETKLDPMFVLRKLAHEETKWERSRQTYRAEMARLCERKATKCEHCSKMTRISRR
jgi:hypothetical protein